MSLPDPHAAAEELLAAILDAAPEETVALLAGALSAARADGLDEAARYVRPTTAEHVSLPRLIVDDRLALVRQLAGAAVRVRAGSPPWGR